MQPLTVGRSLRLVFSVAICVMVLATSAPFAARASTPVFTSSTGVMIPLYSYPGSAWTSVIQAREMYPSVPITVIVNPDNGPSTYSTTYDSWIVALRDAGVTVLGYVPTHFASASLSTVESEIAAYKQMYWVNGVFLDEMPVVPGYASYYSTLTSYAHSDGLPLVVGNPGSRPSSSYIGTTDVLLAYEHAGIPSATTMENVTMGYPSSDFAFVAYGVSSFSASTVDSMGNFASYIYITTGQLPNPYTGVPAYFDGLISELSQYTITVLSVLTSGASFTGMKAVIYYDGNEVDSGFTPLTYTGPVGNPYTVCVENYQDVVFNHWNGWSTSSCRTFGLDQNVQLIAAYSDGVLR
jgi:hypothetical protein